MRLRSARQIGFALAAAVALAGCASPPQGGPAAVVQSDGPVGANRLEANQGGSWEVVLPGGSTGPQLAQGPETSRLDAVLARGPASLIEESYWPDFRGPRLDRLRRIWLTGEPEHLYYFRPGPAWPHYHPQRYRGW